MKINLSDSLNSTSVCHNLDDRIKLRSLYGKKIGSKFDGSILSEELCGYKLVITGGIDKDGFGMKQGVLVNHRVRLLMDGSTSHFKPRRAGERRKKSVRGCIVGPDLSCLNLVIVKRGPADLDGLTNKEADRPSIRGPKRANKIRKVWGLDKNEDVRRYVVRRKIAGKDGKPDQFKSPKIQRLITPVTRQRKRRRITLRKRRREESGAQAKAYAILLDQRRAEKRATLLSKKRELRSEKRSVSTKK
jgi:small subunit ribosomal protein S6e